MTETFNEQLKAIGFSELGKLVNEFLRQYPEVPNRHNYERLRDLRQGTFEELENRSDFQSFIAFYLGIDTYELGMMRRSLRTFELQRTQPCAMLTYAARGAANTDVVSPDSLDGLLKRRVFLENAKVR
jgi:hypothetical protein